jgi:hypothetical protein
MEFMWKKMEQILKEEIKWVCEWKLDEVEIGLELDW